MARFEVRLPDLGLGETPIRLTVWLAGRGHSIERGEPILEVTSGAVTLDLPSPADGLLAEKLVREDDLVKPGDPVAIIETGG